MSSGVAVRCGVAGVAPRKFANHLQPSIKGCMGRGGNGQSRLSVDAPRCVWQTRFQASDCRGYAEDPTASLRCGSDAGMCAETRIELPVAGSFSRWTWMRAQICRFILKMCGQPLRSAYEEDKHSGCRPWRRDKCDPTMAVVTPTRTPRGFMCIGLLARLPLDGPPRHIQFSGGILDIHSSIHNANSSCRSAQRQFIGLHRPHAQEVSVNHDLAQMDATDARALSLLITGRVHNSESTGRPTTDCG